jgi:hypothetical protein
VIRVSTFKLVALAAAIGGVNGAAKADDPDLSASLDFEVKAHYRDSDDNRFTTNFPFTPDMLPPGQDQGELRTVDPGGHFEVSVLSLIADLQYREDWSGRVKVDFFDRYDRNPTSDDRRVDIDELWIQWGQESAPGVMPNQPATFVRVGKFAKFERQDDRHLESYGLVSTAFNRFEDLGVAAGIDLGRHFYLKGSVTYGNPLFFRDPNALAGDNGTDAFLRMNPEPRFNSGIPILYDAEVEGLGQDTGPELGLAAGYRWSDASGRRAFDLMAFGYRRDLEESISLEGTFYGADLDFLRGPGNQFPYPGLAGDDKDEWGINARYYQGDLSLFGQFVDQEFASLGRRGLELEAAWQFELPLIWAYDGQHLFSHIQPVIRYSRLDNRFANPAITPFPSGNWDWVKWDLGLRLQILPGMDLTAEYADNDFETAGGSGSNNEWLVTFRWRT